MKYYNFEVYTQSPDGLVRTRTVRAANAEQAERMIRWILPEGWKIIGTVYQFKHKEEAKNEQEINRRTETGQPDAGAASGHNRRYGARG